MLFDKPLYEYLEREPVLNLEFLKNKACFEELLDYKTLMEKLETIQAPAPPKPKAKPMKPEFEEPEISFWQTVALKKRRILKNYHTEYDRKLEIWQQTCNKVDLLSNEMNQQYEKVLENIREQKNEIEKNIELRKNAFLHEQEIFNENLNVLSVNYQGKHNEAVEKYFELVLMHSTYPEIFPKNAELNYNKENNTLYVAYQLPHPDKVPVEIDILPDMLNQTETIFNLSDDEFVNYYNNIVYKILLKVLHDIFSADFAKSVEAVNINGWVHNLNKGNGQFENVCVATLFSTLNEFEKINFDLIDPAPCFKLLHGVSSASLAGLSPVPASFNIDKKPRENKNEQAVTEQVDNDTNLANMGMAEFEKTLLGLFEKEFRMANGEIRVIQESQDGSFEACGYDPDTIRGGRIIIQARKNTKSVPVSAVKELFGSVIHEGALKGIIVTTSDFTPEAYEFARNKPILLLNGEQLLSIFEKHGMKARINFREAISLKSWLS